MFFNNFFRPAHRSQDAPYRPPTPTSSGQSNIWKDLHRVGYSNTIECHALRAQLQEAEFRIRIYERKFAGLGEKNHVLEEEIIHLQREHSVQVEKQRRHFEQVVNDKEAEQARETSLKVRQLTELTRKLNTVSFRPHPLLDDEACQKMKRLNQGVDQWVATNFRDMERLDMLKIASLSADVAALFQGITEPRNVHERRSLVRAVVNAYLYHVMLKTFVLGESNMQMRKCLEDLGQAVMNQCPPHVFHNWRAATSIAAEHVFLQDKQDVCNYLIDRIEAELLQYSSTDPERRTAKLRALIMNSIEFKQRLERQEHFYHFCYSRAGTQYNPATMQDLTGIGSAGRLVRCSLWPGLCKGTPKEPHTVEKEVVLLQDDESPEAGKGRLGRNEKDGRPMETTCAMDTMPV